MKDRTLAEQLARYMDIKAFVAVKVGKEQAEKLRARREIALKRARTAVRFFEKPENFSRLERRVPVDTDQATPNLGTENPA